MPPTISKIKPRRRRHCFTRLHNQSVGPRQRPPKPQQYYPRCGGCGGLFRGGSVTSTCPYDAACGSFHWNCVRPHMERAHEGQPVPDGYRQSAAATSAFARSRLRTTLLLLQLQRSYCLKREPQRSAFAKKDGGHCCPGTPTSSPSMRSLQR